MCRHGNSCMLPGWQRQCLVPDFRSPTGSFGPHIPNTAQKGLRTCSLVFQGQLLSMHSWASGTTLSIYSYILPLLEMAGLLFTHSCYSGGGVCCLFWSLEWASAPHALQEWGGQWNFWYGDWEVILSIQVKTLYNPFWAPRERTLSGNLQATVVWSYVGKFYLSGPQSLQLDSAAEHMVYLVEDFSKHTAGSSQKSLTLTALASHNCFYPGSSYDSREGHGNPLQYSCLENPRVEPGGLPSMGLHRVGHNWGN